MEIGFTVAYRGGQRGDSPRAALWVGGGKKEKKEKKKKEKKGEKEKGKTIRKNMGEACNYSKTKNGKF